MSDIAQFGILGRLVGKDAHVVEHFGSPMAPVGPELAAGYHKKAIVARRAEFATGRHCAREACRQLGRRCDLIGIQDDRSPAWPNGVIGSITHCEGYVAAAVATLDCARYLGIDAEPDELLPENLIEDVAFGEERRWLLNTGDAPRWARRLFSVKEAVFKAYWPVHRSWLDFRDVSADMDPETSTFRAYVSGQQEALKMSGRFAVEKGLFVSAILE